MKKSKHDADDGGGNCNKAAQAKELIDSIAHWMRDDSKEADKALVAKRNKDISAYIPPTRSGAECEIDA